MEDLPTNIDWIRKKYGENVGKIELIDFQLCKDEDVTEIKHNIIGNTFHEYTIDCEKLSNLILLPIDTKICVSICDGQKWRYFGDVMTFALVKPKRTHMIEASLLMGGGYVIMNRYVVDRGDKVKFVTKKKIDELNVTFTNVLKIKND